MRSRASITALVVLVVSVAAALPVSAQVDARMLRYPDVSDTHIAFVYGGDVWVMDKSGGVARRLSSPAGEESYPRFSPDGSRIAFSGNYDGNTDVYVVPATGGSVQRVTFHPGADRMVEWTPDGRILFASSRTSGVQRYNQLWTISADGGLPERLPVPYGEWIAYTPKDRSSRTWKRYRGGMAPDIWLFNLTTLEARNISDSDANEMQPMFYGNTIYFAADRGPNQRLNIWAYGVDSGDMRQVTRFAEYDIAHAAIGPKEIVFQAGGELQLLDLQSEAVTPVPVQLVSDRATLRPRTVDVAGNIQGAGISPSGARVLFEARGDVYTVPAENGITRNLTGSSGVAERYPAWSPDGRWVAYWSNRSFEYELTLRPAGGGVERVLTSLGEGYRYRPM